jgi:hypothetical protein
MKVNLSFRGTYRVHLQGQSKKPAWNKRCLFFAMFNSETVCPPKGLFTFTGLHSVISQEIDLFIITAVRTSDLLKLSLYIIIFGFVQATELKYWCQQASLVINLLLTVSVLLRLVYPRFHISEHCHIFRVFIASLSWIAQSVLRLGTGWTTEGVRVQVPVGSKIFSTSSRPGPTQPFIQWVPGAVSLGVKRQGREADHSPQASVEVKKMWIYTSTPPYVFMT